MSRKN